MRAWIADLLRIVGMISAIPFLLLADRLLNHGPRPKPGQCEVDVKYPEEPGWSAKRENGWVKIRGVSKQIGAAVAGAEGNSREIIWINAPVFYAHQERIEREMDRFVETGEIPLAGGLL